MPRYKNKNVLQNVKRLALQTDDKNSGGKKINHKKYSKKLKPLKPNVIISEHGFLGIVHTFEYWEWKTVKSALMFKYCVRSLNDWYPHLFVLNFNDYLLL